MTARPGSSARLSLVLGVISFVAWPFSYLWMLSPGSNPEWVGIVVPVAEWGAVVCAIAAIWSGIRARRRGVVSRDATWGPRLGAATLVLVLVAFVGLTAIYARG